MILGWCSEPAARVVFRCQLVLVLADSDATLDHGGAVLAATPLRPGEDPALLTGPDRTERYDVVAAYDADFTDLAQSQHYPLSRAIADFLLSPLNHNEGQDGPNDFDRPQTVDFGVTAVMQIFDAIDLKYDGDDESDERWAEVQREIEFVRRIVKTVIWGGERPPSGLLHRRTCLD